MCFFPLSFVPVVGSVAADPVVDVSTVVCHADLSLLISVSVVNVCSVGTTIPVFVVDSKSLKNV